jgi:hypothetical protein
MSNDYDEHNDNSIEEPFKYFRTGGGDPRFLMHVPSRLHDLNFGLRSLNLAVRIHSEVSALLQWWTSVAFDPSRLTCSSQ